jgi:hypothetical protein
MPDYGLRTNPAANVIVQLPAFLKFVSLPEMSTTFVVLVGAFGLITNLL